MDTRLKRITFACVFFIAGYIIAKFIYSPASTPSQPQIIAQPSTNQLENLHTTVKKLQSTKSQLQQKSNETKAALTVANQQNLLEQEELTPQKITLVTKSELEAELAQLRAFKIKTRNQQFIDWATQYNEQDRLKQMAEAFEETDTTSAPALAQATKLAELFYEDNNLAALSINQSECNGQQCRLTMNTSDHDQVEQLIQTITPALNSHPMFANKGVVILRDTEQGTSYVYINENEENLAF